MGKGPELLQENVGRVASRVGALFLGSHAVFRGKDLHRELGDLDWIALYLYGVTGRRFGEAELRLLDAMWSYTSYPDARIWNNRVVALAGSSRSTGNLGVSAALALSDAQIYGQGPCLHAIDFFLRTRAEIASGADLGACVRKELAARRGVGGYGRPLGFADERIEPLMRLARSLGLAGGPHVQLAHAVDEFLLTGRYRMRMNYAAVIAALAADLGLSPREFYLFLIPVFLAGMLPCYVDALARPEGSFLPLPCTAVAYRGPAPRPWVTPARSS
jgi:hypothetical protein